MTLEELENDFWKDYDYETPLVAKCHEYRKKSVNTLTIEELRLLIGQNIGLAFLIPIALEKLKKNIFAEGDYYEGDLLVNVLKSDSTYWKNNPSNAEYLLEIVADIDSKTEILNSSDEIKDGILSAYKDFKNLT